ncbi:MAG: hypothetical protein A3K03_04560 [Bdellovibrionales bacterium RIFOXYD1_FULL_44_7]|nr:MAG: hypothetical protein A3K03_04560 [Bdellovibrionales bacterium RIFOXYD1_FULL_44_7]
MWWLVDIGRGRERRQIVFNGTESGACAYEIQIRSGATVIPGKKEKNLVVAALPLKSENGPFVYFLQQGKLGPIKIGFTDQSLYTRVRALQTANPEKLRLIGYITGGTEQDEYHLHEKFKTTRIHGEWFYPSAELLGFIKTVSHSHVAQEIIRTVINLRQLLSGIDMEKSNMILKHLFEGKTAEIEELLR